MDQVYIKEQLSWLNLSKRGSASGRRLKVYVRPLDMNFYLARLSRRRLSFAEKISLARDGITLGWKAGATISPREVTFDQLGLMLIVRQLRPN